MSSEGRWGRRREGATAVVTGAAGGFGRATARRLHAEGARVALWDRDGERVAALAAALDAGDTAAPSAFAHAVDLTDAAAVDAAAQATRAALGPITILVNNAGISGAAKPWEVDDADWTRYFDINAHGVFWCVRACLPDMGAARYGKIITIGSLAAQQGRPTTNPAYAASKGAVLGMTVSLARNLGADGICVNAINPGFIRTEIHDQFTPDELAPLTADIPLRRGGVPGAHGIPDDIAAAVAYLASPDGDFVSGAFLPVNGATRTG
jgi:NAD(P)-dependent dehydrogenase (short-subunit alcohol dehydrogenase family)